MYPLPCIDGQTPFPAPAEAWEQPDGLLCYGGDLSVERLISAYQQGIFPWYSADEPIWWWLPAERMVLFPDELHISRSLQRALKKHRPKFYFNRDFERVIKQCANIPRRDHGTWIHPEMINAYTQLFHAGHGFCVEAEVNGQWAGGLYGVVCHLNDKAHIYCGESMCSAMPNGSKYVMVALCQHMLEHGVTLLDCQIHNPHLASMGAKLIPKQEFLTLLPAAS